jgi:prevent-host-death family protein
MDKTSGHILTPAGEFKQKCLAILDEVASGATYVITKRGKPVARLVPLEEPAETERGILTFFRSLAAKPERVRLPEADLLAPSSSFATWSALEEPETVLAINSPNSGKVDGRKPENKRRSRKPLT